MNTLIENIFLNLNFYICFERVLLSTQAYVLFEPRKLTFGPPPPLSYTRKPVAVTCPGLKCY